MNKRRPIAIDPRKQINFIGVIIFIELLEDLKQFSKVFGVRNKPKNPEATPMPRDREKKGQSVSKVCSTETVSLERKNNRHLFLLFWRDLHEKICQFKVTTELIHIIKTELREFLRKGRELL